MSVTSLETLRPITTSEPGSRTSVNSPDSAIGDEAPAPPLPPKQRERVIFSSLFKNYHAYAGSLMFSFYIFSKKTVLLPHHQRNLP